MLENNVGYLKFQLKGKHADRICPKTINDFHFLLVDIYITMSCLRMTFSLTFNCSSENQLVKMSNN